MIWNWFLGDRKAPRPLSHWQLWWEPLQDLPQRAWKQATLISQHPWGAWFPKALVIYVLKQRAVFFYVSLLPARGPSGVLGNTPLLYTWWKISYHCFTLLPILSIRETFRWRRPGNLLLRNGKSCNTGGRQRVHL